MSGATTGPRALPVAAPHAAPDRRPVTYTARLSCDHVLTYEAPTLVPEVGEVVPCRRHGYCAVRSRDGHRAGGGRAGVRRARPRSTADLVAFLRDRPQASVGTLRRMRFSLRLLADAEKEGLVVVDLLRGAVSLPRPPR